MGDIVSFPMTRHGRDGWRFVELVAAQMITRSPTAAEKHLRTQLKRKADVMDRRGFPPDVIKAECQSAEAAIRAALWRAVMEGGAA